MPIHSPILKNTIFLVDDDKDILSSLSALFELSGFKTKTYSSALDYLHQLDDTPGCLISDISMPEMNGIELLIELNKTEHARPTLFITGVATVKLAVEAMMLGAIDFIEKPIIADALLDKVTKILINFEKDKETIDRYKTFTKREKQVHALIVKGLTNSAIAEQIFLTVSTVEKHRSVIMKKMKADNLAMLMTDLPRLKLLGRSLFNEDADS